MTRFMMTLVWTAAQGSLVFVAPRDFRMTHLRTDIKLPNLARIREIYVGKDNQIFGEIDPYDYSAIRLNEIMRRFEAEYGLEGKSDDEAQRYIDKQDLCLPDPSHMDMPPIKAGESITLVG